MEPIAFVALLIPIIALMIPIVWILTAHQRKMAEIMRQQHIQGNQGEIMQLRQDVQHIKEIVAQQAIQMDDFLSAQRKLAQGPPSTPAEIQQRLS